MTARRLVDRWVLSVAPGTVRVVASTAVLVPELVSRVPPPRTWMAHAACADPRLDPALRAVFTADEPTELDPDAQQVCAGCPVRADCVDHTAGITPSSSPASGAAAAADSAPPSVADQARAD